MASPVERLYAAVLHSRSLHPSVSRTARLFSEGRGKMAKKVVEEACEVALDAVQGERRRVVEESADLIYNLTVLWAEMGVKPAEIWAEMERRERAYGLAEKLAKAAGR